MIFIRRWKRDVGEDAAWCSVAGIVGEFVECSERVGWVAVSRKQFCRCASLHSRLRQRGSVFDAVVT